MLNFASVSVRIANTERAVDECVETLSENTELKNIRYIVVNAAMGHRLDKVTSALKQQIPSADVLCTSCGGIIGREGAGESMSHIAVMSVAGPGSECGHAYTKDVDAENSYEKAANVAKDLKKKLPGVNIVYLLTPGIGTRADLIIEAFNEILGHGTIVFGGLSADNYRAVTSFQSVNGEISENMIWALGFADPTIKAATNANHGFVAYGAPMTVTKAENNLIKELDNIPAWAAYSKNTEDYMSRSPSGVVQVLGALASKLPDASAKEYGNTHILRSASQTAVPGEMQLSIGVEKGDKFYMTMRDEDLIFSEQEKAMQTLGKQLGGAFPIAVFQTDCIARGKTLFNRFMKDELIGVMQNALLCRDQEVPPWLGMFGFGEYCPLSGKNVFHTYTTSLLVLYR